LRRSIERLFETARAKQRRRSPLRVDLPHFFGNFDFAFGADFLKNEAHRKQRSEVVRADGFQRARVQNRRHRLGEFGNDVVPGVREAALGKVVLDLIHAQHSISGAAEWRPNADRSRWSRLQKTERSVTARAGILSGSAWWWSANLRWVARRSA